MAAFAPPLAELAFKFGPAEYFSPDGAGPDRRGGAGLTVRWSRRWRWWCWACCWAMIGTDVNLRRCTRFQLRQCRSCPTASSFAVVAMGMFGFAEIIAEPRNSPAEDPRGVHQARSAGMLARRWQEFKRRDHARCCAAPALGSVLGILPGGGAVLASFATYAIEKKTGCPSTREVPFGKGAHPKGLRVRKRPTMPAHRPRFIPMLTLGIPTTCSDGADGRAR